MENHVMHEEDLKVRFNVSLDSNDLEDLAEATRNLATELREMGVETTQPLGEEIPSGAKGVDPTLLGALVVVGPLVITKVLEFVHAWSMRREGQIVSVEIGTPNKGTIKIEMPASMSMQEMKERIQAVQEMVNTRKK
jgi:hypothetical protein